MNVLVDIGGTYARFALEAGGKPVQMKKYAAANFEKFEDALAQYLSEAGAGRDPALFIATAAHPDERIDQVSGRIIVVQPGDERFQFSSLRIVVQERRLTCSDRNSTVI